MDSRLQQYNLEDVAQDGIIRGDRDQSILVSRNCITKRPAELFSKHLDHTHGSRRALSQRKKRASIASTGWSTVRNDWPRLSLSRSRRTAVDTHYTRRHTIRYDMLRYDTMWCVTSGWTIGTTPYDRILLRFQHHLWRNGDKTPAVYLVAKCRTFLRTRNVAEIRESGSLFTETGERAVGDEMERGGPAQKPRGEPEAGLALLTGADWSAEPALRHSSSAGWVQLEAI